MEFRAPEGKLALYLIKGLECWYSTIVFQHLRLLYALVYGPLYTLTESEGNLTLNHHMHLCSIYSLYLSWHSHASIKSDHHTIEHDILYALYYQLCKLTWPSRSH